MKSPFSLVVVVAAAVVVVFPWQAAKLDYVAGTYGGRRRPSRFLCLFLKLLQIQPDEESNGS